MEDVSFFARLGMAFRLVFNGEFARQVMAGLKALEEKSKPAPKVAPQPPEKVHASALLLLSALQREGRLVDFLQQDVAEFSDADVGAGARVVHTGCRKVLKQYLALEPVLAESEGARVTVPQGFDAQRIRLTGNVAGQAPYKGELRHHGWMTKEVKLPAVSDAIDPRVIAPAEVEL